MVQYIPLKPESSSQGQHVISVKSGRLEKSRLQCVQSICGGTLDVCVCLSMCVRFSGVEACEAP